MDTFAEFQTKGQVVNVSVYLDGEKQIEMDMQWLDVGNGLGVCITGWSGTSVGTFADVIEIALGSLRRLEANDASVQVFEDNQATDGNKEAPF